MAGQVISRLTSSGGNDAGVHVLSSSFYGICNTAANAQIKKVIISDIHIDEEVNLVKGMLLTVRFTNINTWGDDEENQEGLPFLQIYTNDGNTAITDPIHIYARAGNNIKSEWNANDVVSFVYDVYNGTGCWIKTETSKEELNALNKELYNWTTSVGSIISDLNNVTSSLSEITTSIGGINSNLDGLVTRVTNAESSLVGSIKDFDLEYIHWTSATDTPSQSAQDWNTNPPTYSPGYYIWQRARTEAIGANGSATVTYSVPVCISGRDGADAESTYQYYLTASPSALINNNGVLSPTSVVFISSRAQGTEAPSGYPTYRIISEFTEPNTWSIQYQGSNGQDSLIYQPSNSNVSLIKCTIYDATETSVQLDTQTVPIIKNGRNGTSVTVDHYEYGISNAATIDPEEWSPNYPSSISKGSWLWTKTVYTGTTTPAIIKSYIGTDGEDGNSVTINSINKDNGITTVVLDNGDGTTSSIIIEDGINGQPGNDSYVHFAWANSADGQNGFTPAQLPNTEYLYMGVYTDNNEEDSEDYQDYTWTLIKGEDGEDSYSILLTNENHTFAATYSAAISASINSEVIAYKGTTPTSVAFASTAITNPTPGMSVSYQNSTNNNNAYFTVSVSPSLTTNTRQGRFSIPLIVDGKSFSKDFSWSLASAGMNGINAYNSTTVLLYKRNSTKPTQGPIGALNYTFSTGELVPATASGSFNNWSVSIPDGVDPCWVIAGVAAAEATATSDNIESWSEPTLFVKNGTNGLNAYNHATISLYKRSETQPNEPATPTYYTFSTGTLTPSENIEGWTTGVTAAEDGEPCWITSVNAISDQKTYTINGWSEPVIFTVDGADGEGISITNREIHYIESNSGTVTPSDSASWNTNIPTVAEGNYLWTRTKITYSDGNVLTSYSVAKQGKGITVTGSSIQYATNNSTTTPTSGWQSNPPTTTPGWYIWTKTTTNYSDNSTVTSYTVGKTGTNGSSAYQYNLMCSPAAVILDTNANPMVFKPSSITVSATRAQGTGNPAAYAGRFKLEAYNGSNWSTVTSSTANESSKSCSIANVSTATTLLRSTLYMAGGTNTAVDVQTIPILKDGTNGENGEDAYTVILSNENQTFPATDAAAKTTVTSNVLAYKGTTLTSATIGSISGHVTGITASITGNSTTAAAITVSASWNDDNLLTTKQGSLNIPITVDGKNFTKQFTWTLAPAGLNQATIYVYTRTPAESVPTPTETTPTATWTFNSKSLTNTPSGWSTVFPEETQGSTTPVWVMSAIASSNTDTDNIEYDDWSTPVRWVSSGSNGKDGENGFNQAVVSIYKQNATQPTSADIPTSNLTHTFSTGSNIFGENNSISNGWSVSLPAASTTPTWMRRAVAVSTAASDVIATNEWSNPAVKYAQLARSVQSITEYYQRTNSTAAPTVGGNDWSITPPQVNADNKYLWNYELILYNDTTTAATIPHIAGTYAKDGEDGRGISAIYNYYQITNNLTIPKKRSNDGEETATAEDDAKWSTTPGLTSVDNRYLWTYEVTNYTTGTSTSTDVRLIGAYGDNGIYPSRFIEQQYLSTSNESPIGGEWVNGHVIWQPDHYIWTRTEIIWSDDNPNDPEHRHIDHTTEIIAENANAIGEQLNRNVLTKSGSGEIVTTDDCAPLPPVGITIWGKSTQNSIPIPSSPVPIVSAAPSNLLRLGDVYFYGNQFATTHASIVDGMLRVTPTTSPGYGKTVIDYLDYSDYGSATLIIGCDVRLAPVESSYTATNGARLYFGFSAASRIGSTFASGYDRYGYKTMPTVTSEWTHYEFTVTMPTDLDTGATAALVGGSQFSIEPYIGASNKPMDFRNLSIRYGTVVIYESGGNQLNGSENPIVSETQTNDPSYWAVGSGGNGVGSIETVTDPFSNSAKAFRITGNTTGNRDFQQVVPAFMQQWDDSAWSSRMFTFSCWARSIDSECTFSLRTYGVDSSSTGVQTHSDTRTVPIPTNWTHIVYSFGLKTALTSNEVAVKILIGLAGAGSMEFVHPSIVYNDTIDHLLIDLQGNELCSLGNETKDYLRIEDGRWRLHKKTGSVDLGTFTWGYSSSRFQTTTVIEDAVLSAVRSNVLCPIYQFASSGSTNNTIFLYNGHIFVYDSAYGEDTAAFKTAMSGIEVIYPLAQEQVIDLGAANLPNLPSPDMSMWVDGTTIDATWWTQYGYETGKQIIENDQRIESEISNQNDIFERELQKTIINSIQLWFVSEQSNIPAWPSQPIIEGTTSEFEYENWRTEVPSYDIEHPYYFYCYQQELNYKDENNNSYYQYTNVVFDKIKTNYVQQLNDLSEIVDATNDIATAINQQFIPDTNGAHIVGADSGLNTTWNTKGILFNNSNNQPVLSLLASEGSNTSAAWNGLVIYDGTGQDETNILSRFTNTEIQLGSINANSHIQITTAAMNFWNEDSIVAFASSNLFSAPMLVVNKALKLETDEGSWGWIPRTNGNLSLKWLGEEATE